MQIGLYSFGDLAADPRTEQSISAGQRLHEVVATARLADDAGLDVFGLGEHHRPDFSISATPVVLAAIAQGTRRLRLTSATTILSTSDPVRVFEDFATVDLLSSGRAEVMVGRGAFLESFPLFGYDTKDYEALFAEKLDLLLQLTRSQRVSWRGRFRPALEAAEVAPRPLQSPLPVWIGVGGNPSSAARAGRLGLPMNLAIIGGTLSQVVPTIETYRRAAADAGHDPSTLPVGISTHAYVADTSQQALQEFFPHYARYLDHVARGAVRVTSADFEQLASPDGALLIGSPQQVAEKLHYQHELFGHQRYLGQLDVGGMPYARVARAIELLAAHVAPVVRRETRAGTGR